MDAFGLDFENPRASRYAIRASSAKSIAARVVLEFEEELMASPQTELEREELAGLIRSAIPSLAFDLPGLQKYIDRTLSNLSEEGRFAISHDLVSDDPDEKLNLVRPTPKALDMAVKLLVERKDTPLDRAVLTIARAIGGLEPDRGGLLDWLELECALREMFDEHVTIVNEPVGTVDVILQRDKDGQPRLAMHVADLDSALRIHAARSANAGAILQKCQGCGSPFLTGGNAAGGKRRKRTDARFCSDHCRWDFNNKRKRQS